MKKPIKFVSEYAQVEENFGALALDGESDLTLQERACQLLQIFLEIEQFAGRVPQVQMDGLLHEAIVGCGFNSDLEALEALLSLGEATSGGRRGLPDKMA